MKIVVSYISSIFDREETIKRIDATSADGIHADFMDGVYVDELNFDLTNPSAYLENAHKPVDIHLMVDKPSSYLDSLYAIKPICIYIHPETEDNPKEVLNDIKINGIIPAIAINPDEELNKYEELYPLVGRVLLMSVVPGKGGQTFIPETVNRLIKLKEYQAKYHFEIFIDGGINDEIINKVKNADGVVSGSFICKHEDYEKQINLLR